MGLPSRSFAADAHHCIMVQVRTGPTEYKCVARMSAPDGELPSDDLRHRKACGYVDDRLRRPAALPRFPSKLEKRGNARLRPHTHRHHSKRGKSISMGTLDAAPP